MARRLTAGVRGCARGKNQEADEGSRQAASYPWRREAGRGGWPVSYRLVHGREQAPCLPPVRAAACVRARAGGAVGPRRAPSNGGGCARRGGPSPPPRVTLVQWATPAGRHARSGGAWGASRPSPRGRASPLRGETLAWGRRAARARQRAPPGCPPCRVGGRAGPAGPRLGWYAPWATPAGARTTPGWACGACRVSPRGRGSAVQGGALGVVQAVCGVRTPCPPGRSAWLPLPGGRGGGASARSAASLPGGVLIPLATPWGWGLHVP